MALKLAMFLTDPKTTTAWERQRDFWLDSDGSPWIFSAGNAIFFDTEIHRVVHFGSESFQGMRLLSPIEQIGNGDAGELSSVVSVST